MLYLLITLVFSSNSISLGLRLLTDWHDRQHANAFPHWSIVMSNTGAPLLPTMMVIIILFAYLPINSRSGYSISRCIGMLHLNTITHATPINRHWALLPSLLVKRSWVVHVDSNRPLQHKKKSWRSVRVDDVEVIIMAG